MNLKLPELTVDDNLSDFGRLVRELRKILKKDTISAELNVLKKMAGILRESVWKTTVTVAARNDGYEIVNIEPENKTLQNYAIVIDMDYHSIRTNP